MEKLLDIIESSKTKLLKERILELELALLDIKKNPASERVKKFRDNVIKFHETKNNYKERFKALGEINDNLSFVIEDKNIEINKLERIVKQKDNTIKQLKLVIENLRKENENV